MNASQALTSACLSVVASAAWAGLWFFLPSVRRSRFRNELWALRDEVVDEVILGQMPDCEATGRFVTDVEAVIRNAREYRFSALLALSGALRDAPKDFRMPARLEPEPIKDPACAARLAAYEERLVDIITDQVLHGSVTGLGVSAAVGVVSAFNHQNGTTTRAAGQSYVRARVEQTEQQLPASAWERLGVRERPLAGVS